MSILEKSTASDKRKYISRALSDNNIGGYLQEYTDEEVLYETYEGGDYKEMKAPYTINGNSVTIDFDSAVEATTETILVEKSKLEKIITSVVNKCLGSSEAPKASYIEKYNHEEHTAIEPLYIAYGEVDAHGEAYKSKEDVFQLVESLTKSNESGDLLSSLFHTHITKSFSLVKAWVNEVEVEIDGVTIPAYQPIAEIKFENKEAFELRKSKSLMGLSIGCGVARVDASQHSNSPAGASKLLTKFDFSTPQAHLTYTDDTNGGAASLKNDFYAIKSANFSTLSAHQKEIIEDLNEEFQPLFKSSNTPDSADKLLNKSHQSNDETNITQNGNEDSMSEKEKKLEEQVAFLTKQVADSTKTLVSNSLDAFGFEAELKNEVTEVLIGVGLEARDTVLKAFSMFAESAEAIQKSLGKPNALAVALMKEVGADEDPTKEDEAPATLTLKQKLEIKRQEKEDK